MVGETILPLKHITPPTKTNPERFSLFYQRINVNNMTTVADHPIHLYFLKTMHKVGSLNSEKSTIFFALADCDISPNCWCDKVLWYHTNQLKGRDCFYRCFFLFDDISMIDTFIKVLLSVVDANIVSVLHLLVLLCQCWFAIKLTELQHFRVVKLFEK